MKTVQTFLRRHRELLAVSAALVSAQSIALRLDLVPAYTIQKQGLELLTFLGCFALTGMTVLSFLGEASKSFLQNRRRRRQLALVGLVAILVGFVALKEYITKLDDSTLMAAYENHLRISATVSASAARSLVAYAVAEDAERLRQARFHFATSADMERVSANDLLQKVEHVPLQQLLLGLYLSGVVLFQGGLLLMSVAALWPKIRLRCHRTVAEAS